MNPGPDRELLPQAAARQLLERAGQIDSDSTTVDTLRAAAREAGISEAAFETALAEMRGRMAEQNVIRRRPNRRLIATLVAGVMLMAASVLVIIPSRAGRSQARVEDHEILVKCLPMTTAQSIAQTMLVGPENEVQLSAGSRILRVRATRDQVAALEANFEASAKRLSSCDNTVIR